jgi:hypothetical protein
MSKTPRTELGAAETHLPDFLPGHRALDVRLVQKYKETGSREAL